MARPRSHCPDACCGWRADKAQDAVLRELSCPVLHLQLPSPPGEQRRQRGAEAERDGGAEPASFIPPPLSQGPGVTREGVSSSSVPPSRVTLSPTVGLLLIFKQPDDELIPKAQGARLSAPHDCDQGTVSPASWGLFAPTGHPGSFVSLSPALVTGQDGPRPSLRFLICLTVCRPPG